MMATYTPAELLQLWKLEQIPLEMTTGHLLQYLVKLHSELEIQRTVAANLRADVDRLIVHTRLPGTRKGKQKPSKPDEMADREQPS